MSLWKHYGRNPKIFDKLGLFAEVKRGNRGGFKGPILLNSLFSKS